MPTEQLHTEPRWAGLPGKVLEGGYELQDLLEADQDRAKYKIRVLGAGATDAVVSLVRAEGAAAASQVAVWDAVRNVGDANLNVPLACGQTQLDGVHLVYVVLRKPDEVLSGVLRERALSAEEAGEVLVSISHALDRLRSHRLVHGCISPEHIQAFGDSIQLSTECVRSVGTPPSIEMARAKYVAPESAGVNVRPAADVWCLGATLFEVLTQRDFGIAWRDQLAAIPAPFPRIIERCLDPDPQTRCELPEVLALYRGKRRSTMPRPRPAPLPELTRIPEINRTPPAKPGADTSEIPQQRADARRGMRPLPATWIYAAVAVIAVLLVIWAAWPKHAAPARSGATNVASQNRVPAASKGAWPTRTLAPETASTSPRAAAQPQASVERQPLAPAANPPPVSSRSEPSTINGPIWRLVLFTYNRQEAAQNRAQLINEKHSDLQAAVFSPNGNSGPYLVVIGGRMDRDAAERLRQKALRLGMPRDSYIQNYRE